MICYFTSIPCFSSNTNLNFFLCTSYAANKPNSTSKLMKIHFKVAFMRFVLLILAAVAGMCSLQSCDNDEGYSLDTFAVEIMTAQPISDDTYYFIRDNGETLWPLANSDYRFNPKYRQRAQVNYTMLSDSISGYSHGIKVNWVDGIRTKAIAPFEGERNDSIYGTDPIELIAMEVGGGFLDVLFGANYGNSGESHYINLIPVKGGNESPYELEFRHNAYNDPPLMGAQGLVSFDLSSLPDTEGKTVKLKIKFHTFDGDVIKEVDFNSSVNTYTGSVLLSGTREKLTQNIN